MRKKHFFIAIAIVACWTTYSDLNSGSLPASATNQASIQVTGTEHAAIPHKRIKVNPGDTLLSISERLNKDEPSIEQLLKDFALLNPSADPNHLEIGKDYAFPLYYKSEGK
ncbi:LysM peptidoglycan-binding domain-containing protein [Sporolactobacillus spathodeae]|uniref:LysM domain-containing protein n=1 Tax=Sporolactobacillus spathodeae TaxID=1465502 RepID=A0ABS2Q7B7_9BACL|nr:LysM domain-containing protein [Sporolactobacillus spathodeae]MBM7657315.1 hypothetical protein [Sporolactobacillus spathodeae]